MRKKVINIIGIPLITFCLFVFQSSNPQYYISELTWSFIISMILWHGNALIIGRLNSYIPWGQRTYSRISIQLGASILFTIWLTYFAVKYLYSGVYDAHFSSLVFRRNLFVFLIISLLYNALYSGMHFFNKWRSSIVEAEKLKRQNLLSQYELLKTQINPHFLFNSLNTLIGLIDQDAELAKEYGYQFASSYRKILSKGNEELITLKDEMEIIEIQKHLLTSRFGKGLLLELDISLASEIKKIPPLSLQTLLENAVKHNVVSRNSPLKVRISARHDKLTITNNLQPKNLKEASTKLGLQNLIMRYSFLTNQKIEIENNQTEFRVTIPLLDQKEL